MTTKINEELLKSIKSQRKKIKECIYSNQTRELLRLEKELEAYLVEVRAEKNTYMKRDKYAMKNLLIAK